MGLGGFPVVCWFLLKVGVGSRLGRNIAHMFGWVKGVMSRIWEGRVARARGVMGVRGEVSVSRFLPTQERRQWWVSGVGKSGMV